MVNRNMATDTYILTLDPDGGFLKHEFVEWDSRAKKDVVVGKYTTKPKTIQVQFGE